MPQLILPVPHVQQRQAGECLAACAGMMLSYLGLSVSYDQLLQVLQIEPDIGAPLSNVRTLESLGVTVSYQQGTLIDLQQHLTNNRPCLVPVQTGELPYWAEQGYHAVVVTGFEA